MKRLKETLEEGYDSDDFISDKITRVVDVYDNDENYEEIPTKAFKGNIAQLQSFLKKICFYFL